MRNLATNEVLNFARAMQKELDNNDRKTGWRRYGNKTMG
jgi:hypothetical protein